MVTDGVQIGHRCKGTCGQHNDKARLGVKIRGAQILVYQFLPEIMPIKLSKRIW